MDNEIMQAKITGVVASRNGCSFGFVLDWSEPKKGFGNIRIFTEDGVTYVDSEHMSKEFVVAALTALVNNAELVD